MHASRFLLQWSTCVSLRGEVGSIRQLLARSCSTATRFSEDRRETEKFTSLASEWWSLDGPFGALHKLNPVRCQFIRDVVCRQQKLDAHDPEPFRRLRMLDVGCGGGILSESLARMGASVVGIDTVSDSVKVASCHAQHDPIVQSRVMYQVGTAEELAAAGDVYDVVVASEVIEHVKHPIKFCDALATLTSPHGSIVVTTINRTVQSYAAAIVAAEYVLGWVPRGTHDWRKFVTPEELSMAFSQSGYDMSDLAGMSYDVLRNAWRLSDDVSVNYAAAFNKHDLRKH